MPSQCGKLNEYYAMKQQVAKAGLYYDDSSYSSGLQIGEL
jgi:hypothetical protein